MAPRIYLMGRIAVEAGDELVFDETAFRGRQPKLLFAYLTCHRNQSVSRDKLADVLWHEALPSNWDSSLNAIVSRVRSLLANPPLNGGQWLGAASGEYALTYPPGTWVDIEELGSAVDEAEAALRARDMARAAAPANIAAAISARSFLPAVEGEWIEEMREHQTRQRVRALECLARIWIHNGETGTAIETLSQVIAVDPYRESSYRLLISALAAEGNRARSVLVFRQLSTRLRDDLGVEPSPETVAVLRAATGETGRVRRTADW